MTEPVAGPLKKIVAEVPGVDPSGIHSPEDAALLGARSEAREDDSVLARVSPDTLQVEQHGLRERIRTSGISAIDQMRLTADVQSADSLDDLNRVDAELERLVRGNSTPATTTAPAAGTATPGAQSTPSAATAAWATGPIRVQATPHAQASAASSMAPVSLAVPPAVPGNSMDTIERNIATLTQQVTALTQHIESLVRQMAATPTPAAPGTSPAATTLVPASLPDVTTPDGAGRLLDMVNTSVTTLQNRVAAAKRGLEANGTWTDEDQRLLDAETDPDVKSQMGRRKQQISEWKRVIEESERRIAPFTAAIARQEQQIAAAHPPAVVTQADRIRENIGDILHRRERGWKNFLPHWFKMVGTSAAVGVSTGILLRFFFGNALSGGWASGIGALTGAASAGARSVVEVRAARTILQKEIEKARAEGNESLATQKEEQLQALNFKHWKTWRRALGNVAVGAGIGAIAGLGAYEFYKTEMGQSARAWMLGLVNGVGAGKGVGALSQATQNAVPTKVPQGVTDVPKLGGRIPIDPSMVGPRGPGTVPPVSGPRGTFMPIDPSSNPKALAETRRLLAVNGITLRPDQHVQIVERQGQRLTAIYQDMCARGNRKSVLIGVFEQRNGWPGAKFHPGEAARVLDSVMPNGRRGSTFAEQVQQRSRPGGNASYVGRNGQLQRWTPSNTTFGRGVVGGRPVTDARILNPDFVNRVQGMFGGGRSNVADVTPGFRGRIPGGVPIADAAGPRISAVPPSVVETVPVEPRGRVVPGDAYRFTPRGSVADVSPQTNNNIFSGRAAEVTPLPSDGVPATKQFNYVSPRAAGFEHVVEPKVSVGNNAWAFMQKSLATYMPQELRGNKAALDTVTQALWQELGKLDATKLSQLGFQNGTNIALIGDKGPGQVLNFTRFFADEGLMTNVMRTLQKGDPTLFAKIAPGLSEAHAEAVKSINPSGTTRIIEAWEEAMRRLGQGAQPTPQTGNASVNQRTFQA